ncbi:MAG TPA: HAMP domain-containing sensor histidine kinase [Candidatus Thermoplasmatota archaeon]|nr:HAMP domain-containing sensor histidine kinase [Candidatus Thermoplasmatota archaeon]
MASARAGSVTDPRRAIVSGYTLIAALYCSASAALFWFVVGSLLLTVVHAAAFVVVVVNYAVLRRTGDYDVATHVILADGTTVVVSLFATGGWEGTGYLWPFAYLPYAFFLATERQATGWVAALFAACAAATVLDLAGVIDIPYSGVAIANFFAALSIFVACMFVFARARSRFEDERHARLERQRELERLLEIDAFKTQFLNNTAHELATPLTPVKLQIHLLKRGPQGSLTPEQVRGIEILDRNVERLERLVHETLDAARLQSSRLGLRKERIDMKRVVDDAVDLFREPAKQAGITLRAEAPAPIPVDADPGRISQVLVNLISNAIKFTPDGGSVVVEARAISDAARVSVRDNGVGLDPAQIARLFQPFSQVHDAGSRVVGGSGLGLYISRGIIELHGGTIQATSPGRGRGATFSFVLPSP